MPFDQVSAGEAFGRAILGANAGDLMELTEVERNRVFNLGYYTWVEQRGLSVEEFECRRPQSWWRRVHSLVPQWDELIEEFNGVNAQDITLQFTDAATSPLLRQAA